MAKQVVVGIGLDLRNVTHNVSHCVLGPLRLHRRQLAAPGTCCTRFTHAAVMMLFLMAHIIYISQILVKKVDGGDWQHQLVICADESGITALCCCVFFLF